MSTADNAVLECCVDVQSCEMYENVLGTHATQIMLIFFYCRTGDAGH